MRDPVEVTAGLDININHQNQMTVRAVLIISLCKEIERHVQHICRHRDIKSHRKKIDGSKGKKKKEMKA